jgi:glycosyltransferase involved in cell wall biosynthesis
MTNPDISVIIPTSRNAADLEFCLGALLKQNAVNFEVIIVTKSGEGYDCLKEKFSGLNLIFINEKERKGLSAARNLGLLSAKGDIVSYIDDDVLVGKDWLKEVMATFQKSTNIGGVTGPTIIPSDSLGNRDILAFHNKIEKNIFWKIIGKLYTAFVLENKPYCIGKIFKSGGFSLGSNYIDATKMNKDLEVDYLEA